MMSSKGASRRNLSIENEVKQDGGLLSMRSNFKRSVSLRCRDSGRKQGGECQTLPKLKRSLSIRSLLKSQRSSRSCLVSRKQPEVVQMIANESWRGLREHLSTEAGMAEASACISPVNEKGDNILHLACRLRPPVDLVRRIIQANAGTVRQLNARKQTPLHVAASWGASPQVVRLLVKRFREAAVVQDLDGKTPLHLSCEKCSAEGTCDPGNAGDYAKPVKGPMLGVVKALCIAAPGCVNVEDEDGVSPLEYSIYQGAEIEIVKALQKVSQRYWVASNKRMNSLKWRNDNSDMASTSSSISSRTTKTSKSNSAFSQQPRRRTASPPIPNVQHPTDEIRRPAFLPKVQNASSTDLCEMRSLSSMKSKRSSIRSQHRVRTAATPASKVQHPMDEIRRPAYLSVLRDARMFRSTGGNEMKKLLANV